MVERLRTLALSFADERVRGTASVLTVNGCTLGFINLVDLTKLAELGLILLSAAYTIWRWRREARGGNREDSE